MENKLKKNKIGVGNFSRLRREGDVYVDKTMHIDRMLTADSDLLILTRPRRFGKTLLLTTLEQVLLGKKDKFENTFINSHECKFDWKSSRVISLSMAACGGNPQTFDHDLRSELHDIGRRYGLDATRKGYGDSIYSLISALSDSHEKIPLTPGSDSNADMPEVSILIDEFDYQMNFNSPYPEKLRAIQLVLSNFFSSLKVAYDRGMVRFVLLAGILNADELSLISDLNSFVDITYDPLYSTICGFTKKEIRSNFNKHISSSLKTMKQQNHYGNLLTFDDMFGSLTEWYDGYSWDGIHQILNPYSVLNCIENNVFERYWYDTGAPGFMETLNIKNKDYFKIYSDNISHKSSIHSRQIKHASPTSTLLATGYLTIEKVETCNESIGGKVFHLTVPNSEVRISLSEDYLSDSLYPGITQDLKEYLQDIANQFCKAVCNFDSINATELLSIIFSKIPCPKQQDSEQLFNNNLKWIFSFVKGHLEAESSVGEGIVDFIVKTYRDLLIIQVKQGRLKNNNQIKIYDGKLKSKHASENTDNNGTSDTSQLNDINVFNIDPSISQNNNKQSQTHEIQNIKIIPDPKIEKLLSKGINDAFDLIFSYRYDKSILEHGNRVWATAISIIDRDHVKVRFKQIKDITPDGAARFLLVC
jgi:hypothetical protein